MNIDPKIQKEENEFAKRQINKDKFLEDFIKILMNGVGARP